jgi:dipeptidyl aminopeptidase/acylaminoacyl peptidase
MLAAERDKRIKRVVEWAGPTDWFESMGEEGWTQRELVEEGLRIHAKPNETAGQFIERFLLKGINGTWNLEDTRLKMIASSPLYFASSLPAVQIHHGVEDYSVPIANASALVSTLDKQGRSKRGLEHYFYEGFGHDTDVPIATERSRKFLTEKTATGHKVRR